MSKGQHLISDPFIPERASNNDVAVRPLLADETTSILRAILSACDYGVLLTDLEHRSLACNRRFGELFDIEPADVVTCTVAGLRKKVLPFIVDRKAWLQQLDVIYGDPNRIHEDELRIKNRPAQVLKRFSGPVHDSDGSIIGRLWTFRDVTVDSKISNMSRVMLEISSLHDPDPATVCKGILDKLCAFFGGSTAIISIRKNDFMEFKAISGPFSPMKLIRGNVIQDSYCKFALESMRPFMIQNARDLAVCQGMKPALVGYTRYLGVPVRDISGEPIGTLCIIDRKSDQELDDWDVQLMSLMAMRVSTELNRESMIRDRLAEKDNAIHVQQSEMTETRRVLAAMNKAFSLVTERLDSKSLLKTQTKLLYEALDYPSSGLLIVNDDASSLSGFVIPSGSKTPLQATLEIDPRGRLFAALNDQKPTPVFVDLVQFDADISTITKTKHATAAVLPLSRWPRCVVLLGSDRESRHHEDRQKMHLDAIIDQIYLVLATHLLQDQLLATNEQLSEAHGKLVQSEKLSIVGTLAASTAHDIRNIVSSLTLLTSPGCLAPDQALTAVREQLDRFNLLAHRLLSYAKPRMVAQQTVDIPEIVREVIALARVHLEILKVKSSVQIDGNASLSVGDPHQLQHLFLNLVLNAGNAMRSTGGDLHVSIKRTKFDVEIMVSDTGTGLPKEVARRLFEPFSSSNPDGFGLGLFSCKRIVEAHGGTIDAKKNRNKGTTFTVKLPASETDQ